MRAALLLLSLALGSAVFLLAPRRPDAGTAPVHTAPWALARGADASTLFVATPGTRQVAVVDASKRAVLRHLDVDGRVRGLELAPDGALLAASRADRDDVVLLDPEDGRVARTLAAGRSPAGLAFGPGGNHLYVANMASHDVSVFDVARGREIRRLAGGREPFAVRRSPDGRTIAVLSRRSELTRPEALPYAVVTLIDTRTHDVRRVVRLDSCHMGEALAFTEDGAHLLVPAILVRNRLPILQVARGWVMSSVLAAIDVESGDVRLLPLTEPREGFPDPSGIALAPGGARAWVVSGGRDRLAEVDVPALLEVAGEADGGQVQKLSWTGRYVRRYVPLGSNPRAALRVGSWIAVSERLGDSVALVDPDSGDVARLVLGSPPADDAVHRGARNFHSARYAFQQAFACRSCHPDGHTDGLTYDFDIDGVGRNILLNRSLQGVGGTSPFKWSGKNPTLERQCGARFAMVLTRADPMEGRELKDLVAYMRSIEPTPADPNAGRVAGRPTGGAARGKRIFERAVRKDGTPIPRSGRCITCHPPPRYSSRLASDVGTRGPGDSTGRFDTPHLTGVGSKAPYLHDGRARTLEEIWTQPGVGDQHGVVSDLTKAELSDLVEYLKGL